MLIPHRSRAISPSRWIKTEVADIHSSRLQAGHKRSEYIRWADPAIRLPANNALRCLKLHKNLQIPGFLTAKAHRLRRSHDRIASKPLHVRPDFDYLASNVAAPQRRRMAPIETGVVLSCSRHDTVPQPSHRLIRLRHASLCDYSL